MIYIFRHFVIFTTISSLFVLGACRKESGEETENLGTDDINIIPVSGNAPAEGAVSIVAVTGENGEQSQSYEGNLLWKQNGSAVLEIEASVNEYASFSLDAQATHQSLAITYAIDSSNTTCNNSNWIENLTINSAGLVTGIPSSTAIGSCVLTVKANTFNQIIEATISIETLNVDDPPTWDNTIADQSLGDYQDINLTVNASDPDVGQQIIFKFDRDNMTCDDGSWDGLAINAVTGIISGFPTTSDIDSSCTVKIIATAGPLSISDDFTISVINVPTPPMWDAEIPNQVQFVGLDIAVTANANDNDPAETPTYSLDLANMTCDDGNWTGLAIDTNSGAITGAPATADIGNCTIRVLATSNSESIAQTFSVQVTNIVANDDLVSMTEDDANVSGNAVANDSNVTSVVSANFGTSIYGVMAGNSDATWTYTLNSSPIIQALNPTESLTETISYEFLDSVQGLAGANIIITINGVNDDPFTSSNVSYTFNKTQSDVGFDLLAEDLDNGDSSQFSAASGSSANGYGTYAITTAGQFTYNLNRLHASVRDLVVGQSVTDSVDVQMTDTNGGSSTVTINLTIEGVNPGFDSIVTIYEEDPDSTANSDIDDLTADPITSGVGSQNLGTFDLASDGSWTYTLNNAHATVQGLGEGESIDDVIAYTGVDGASDPVTANLTAKIRGVNDLPQITTPVPDVSVSAGVTETIDLSGATATSSSGTAANIIDGNTGTVVDTNNATASVEWVEVAMDDSYEFDDITLEFNGNIGNSVIQIINEQDVVVTREVLPASVSSSPHTVSFEPLVGAKIKILRPVASSASTGDLDLQIREITVNGSLTPAFSIAGATHFSDTDINDTLTYSALLSSGAPIPNWISINPTTGAIAGLVPQDVNIDVVLKAEDLLGKFVTDTFNIYRPADGGTTNRAPVSLLQIEDEKRGGVTRIRYGGNAHFTNAVDKLQGGTETVEFLLDPDQSGLWNIDTLDVEDKYLVNGQILPFVNSEREYGEKYRSFFVPALSGIYRFRTNGTVDDGVVLGVSTTEYTEDRIDVMISSTYFESQIESGFGIDIVYGTEFANGNSRAFAFDTSPFFDGSFNTDDSKDGYIYLEKGNVYYFEIKFAEQGGAAVWSFEFDRRDKGSDPSSGWDGWAPLAASQMVPTDGADAYTPNIIPASGGVNYDASVLFYDAEQDTLSFSAKIVQADGSSFSGPLAGTDQVAELGLTLNTSTGLLTGTLSNYTNERIIFSASDPTGSAQTATGLMIKFDPSVAP